MEVAGVRLRLMFAPTMMLTEAPVGGGVWMYTIVIANGDTRRLPFSDDVFRSLVVSQTNEPCVA